VVRYEQGLPGSVASEERISKLYRLHRVEPAFRRCFASPAVTDVLRSVIGPHVDLFLSQIVFKLPGALGQPWHQDASIFPFEPAGPVVGVWCALTDATGPSSQLVVDPASHRSGQRPHGRDTTHPTGGRYVALVDQAVSGAKLLDLCCGDAVFLDSALVHGSTDNRLNEARVAATAHFASAGTIDRTQETFGANPFNDWTPWLRDGRLIHS